MDHFNPFKLTVLKYGLYLSTLMIALFLLMEVTEFSGTISFQFLEVVIIYLIVGRAIDFFRTHSTHQQGYIKSIGLASATGAFGMLVFVTLLIVYMSLFDSGYIVYLREIVPLGPYLNAFTMAVWITVEGAAIGAISGFLQAFFVEQADH